MPVYRVYFFVGALSVITAACAQTTPKVIVSSSNEITIEYRYDLQAAGEIAKSYCAKSGRETNLLYAQTGSVGIAKFMCVSRWATALKTSTPAKKHATASKSQSAAAGDDLGGNADQPSRKATSAPTPKPTVDLKPETSPSSVSAESTSGSSMIESRLSGLWSTGKWTVRITQNDDRITGYWVNGPTNCGKNMWFAGKLDEGAITGERHVCVYRDRPVVPFSGIVSASGDRIDTTVLDHGLPVKWRLSRRPSQNG